MIPYKENNNYDDIIMIRIMHMIIRNRLSRNESLPY